MAITAPNELTQKLISIVGALGVVEREELATRAKSVTDPSPHEGLALIKPSTTEELSKVMSACNDSKAPVVVQGGLSGLVGGGEAKTGEIAISLERMNAIEKLDTHGRTITVGAGAIFENVQQAAAKQGLLLAVDWGARGSATVGGAISTNAGGNSVLRYGMMREQVLGVEVVLADGSVLSCMNELLKNNTGYDLKHLFIGSEGTLGIVTRAVLRLRSAPRAVNTALVAVETFDAVTHLLSNIDTKLGGTLTAYEVMWQNHFELIVREGKHRWVLPEGYPFYVLMESTSGESTDNTESFQNALAETMEVGLVTDAIVCTSEAQRNEIWAIREDIDTLFRTLDPPIPFDISVPLRHMDEYVTKVRKDIKDKFPQVRDAVFGHLGDSNLHYSCTVGSDPEAQAAVSNIVYKNLLPFRGSISAEHGIGTTKRPYLEMSRNAGELAWMRQLKTLFDPNNILNQGRVI